MSPSLVEWQEDYISGIDIIDKQHKDFISVLNKIHNPDEECEYDYDLDTLLKELDFYVNVHFKTEEEYAQKYNFPNIKELKDSHDFFRLLYNEIENYCPIMPEYFQREDIKNYVRRYTRYLHSVMTEWLTFHLNTMDKILLDFLRENRSKNKQS